MFFIQSDIIKGSTGNSDVLWQRHNRNIEWLFKDFKAPQHLFPLCILEYSEPAMVVILKKMSKGKVMGQLILGLDT